MNHPNLLLLYVQDPTASSLFYEKLLQKAPDIAATVIVGGFMEGLIGPLSPLSRQQHDGTDSYQRQVAALADQIAQMACASVAALSATP